MKSGILFFLLLVTSAQAFAQSKKQLNAELVRTKWEYDSISTLAVKKADQFLIKQQDFEAAQLRNTQRQATDLKDALKSVEKSYDQLIRLEKEPGKLVRLADLKTKISEFHEKLYVAVIPSNALERQTLILLKDTMPEKKRRRKEQKKYLREQVTRYSLATEVNKTKMIEMDKYSGVIDRVRPELDSIYLNYEQVLYGLALEESVLLDTIQKLRAFSLRDWPKNFTPAFEREFGKPERNEISQPTGEGWSTHVWYAYNEPVELVVDFIRYANPIPINEFSVEKMKSQGNVIRRFDPDPSLIYSNVDEEAEFPGGRVALLEYLSENFRFPEIVKEIGIQMPRQVVQFVVNKDGSISNIQMKKGTRDCRECDEEVIRVIKQMPEWIPAKINGKAVNSLYLLPVTICLR